MTRDQKSKVEQDAARIVDWLVSHRAEFEQGGIEESELPGSVGLSEDEVRPAIDQLESHEEVVRWPQALTSPPRFLLKPGRGWPDLLNKDARTDTAAGR
jgi:hypothetical protein